MLRKAKTLKDIYNIFKPEEFLMPAEEGYYVDIFKKDLEFVNKTFTISENEQETLFIAGQPGNGKSTALRMLPIIHKEIDEKFDIIYLNGRDNFDPSTPIDAIDVVLMVGFLFANEDDELKAEYIKKLENLRKEKLEELEKIQTSILTKTEQEQTSINSGFKIDLAFLNIGTSFKDDYRFDNESREVTRKLLKSKRKDFMDLTNEIIKEYRQNKDKEILLIIDDIEKVKNSDAIFTRDIGLLLEIACAKIITMPIHLKRNNTFAGQKTMEFSIKVKEKKEDKCIKENIDLLENIIKHRIDDAYLSKLITEESIEKLAIMSGGNIRQLIILTKDSALDAIDFDKISLKNVNSAIYNLKKQYSSATQIMDKFLKQIEDYNKPKDYEEKNLDLLAKATQQQMIFAYHNNESWYDVNPIVLDEEPCQK